MKIEYNSAVDLCCAMLQFVHWDEIKGFVPGYTYSPELDAWYEEVNNGLSGVIKADLNYLIHDFIGLIFLPVDLALNENIVEPKQLIQRLESADPQLLTERLFNTYLTGRGFAEVAGDDDKILSAIRLADGTTKKNEAEKFLDYTRSPDAYRSRLADTMRKFLEVAFEPFSEIVQNEIFRQIEADQMLLDSDPDRFFSGYCRTKPEDGLETSRLLISFFDELDIIYIDNPSTIIYGRCRFLMEDSGSIPLEQIYSLLADESRRTILQMLCRKPWFIREIADELNITSATVSYHMSKLSALDLVSYEQGERKRIYYRANRANVDKMLEMLKKDITGI